MDILKEIMAKSKNTVINEAFVVIDGKQIDKTTEIEVGDASKKRYTLEQLAFFILNKDVMYTQYLKKCKEQNIGPIFYTDQKVIHEELQKVKEETPQYYFDTPEKLYLSKHDYSWVRDFFTEKETKVSFKTTNEPFKIVVPSSIISYINLSNIEEFLKHGEVKKNNSLVLDKLEIVLRGKTFIIEDTIDNWTSEDWKSLVGIFVDGTSYQLDEWKIGDIAGLFSKIPVFYLYEKENERAEALDGYKIKRVKIESKKCKNEDLEEIWRLILDICQSSNNGL